MNPQGSRPHKQELLDLDRRLCMNVCVGVKCMLRACSARE